MHWIWKARANNIRVAQGDLARGFDIGSTFDRALHAQIHIAAARKLKLVGLQQSGGNEILLRGVVV